MTTSPWPNFSLVELRCKCGHCGSDGREMDTAFMERLQQLRTAFGKPIKLSSAYRCPKHPVEAKKAAPGEHCTGKAVDIAIRGPEAVELLRLALDLGFTRIGISQKGAARFIHLGTSAGGRFPSPALWSY
ncbi:D-Ala-D-Ala carboxypeptidase family metallohydrolase [Pseudomonas tohonis]|uniref:D-Ala-D-Ala carboxypeptidase family metallohydrolase n=1 Tax=Pseudomonas tohonis TaxID=2725477 RepID=UPI0022EFF85F|nr:D-Ala-D-Ala carboxypeptidase family metallohydrolase [Pseudomonas tohonis]